MTAARPDRQRSRGAGELTLLGDWNYDPAGGAPPWSDTPRRRMFASTSACGPESLELAPSGARAP
jgi:hypothetical protein